MCSLLISARLLPICFKTFGKPCDLKTSFFKNHSPVAAFIAPTTPEQHAGNGNMGSNHLKTPLFNSVSRALMLQRLKIFFKERRRGVSKKTKKNMKTSPLFLNKRKLNAIIPFSIQHLESNRKNSCSLQAEA